MCRAIMIKKVGRVMSKQIKIEKNEYELIKEYKDGFSEEDFKNRYTDFFEDYDYIFGDYSYEKLRLKGYFDKTNKRANKINNIEGLETYIKEFCSHECKYFLLKKIKK